MCSCTIIHNIILVVIILRRIKNNNKAAREKNKNRKQFRVGTHLSSAISWDLHMCCGGTVVHCSANDTIPPASIRPYPNLWLTVKIRKNKNNIIHNNVYLLLRVCRAIYIIIYTSIYVIRLFSVCRYLYIPKYILYTYIHIHIYIYIYLINI